MVDIVTQIKALEDLSTTEFKDIKDRFMAIQLNTAGCGIDPSYVENYNAKVQIIKDLATALVTLNVPV